jgi:flagellar hook protein FlgE
MDVIGNNVANVNTLGFKSGRVTFQEVFSQTLRGAGAPDAAMGKGGTNPMQIGLGTGVGAVDTLMTRGSTQRTDNPTDLSIEGEGFFIVKGSNVDTFKFTRAGNFGLDKLGNLVSGSGMNVYGWMDYEKQIDGTVKYNTESEMQPINLYSDEFNGNKRIIDPKATTVAKLSGNLNSGFKPADPNADPPDPAQFSVPFTVYDSLGNAHELRISYWKGDRRR